MPIKKPEKPADKTTSKKAVKKISARGSLAGNLEKPVKSSKKIKAAAIISPLKKSSRSMAGAPKKDGLNAEKNVPMRVKVPGSKDAAGKKPSASSTKAVPRKITGKSVSVKSEKSQSGKAPSKKSKPPKPAAAAGKKNRKPAAEIPPKGKKNSEVKQGPAQTTAKAVKAVKDIKPGKSEKSEKSSKSVKSSSSAPAGKTGKKEKPAKVPKNAKSEKSEKSNKKEIAEEKVKTKKVSKTGKLTEKSAKKPIESAKKGKAEKVPKPEKTIKTPKTSKIPKATKAEKAEKADKAEKSASAETGQKKSKLSEKNPSDKKKVSQKIDESSSENDQDSKGKGKKVRKELSHAELKALFFHEVPEGAERIIKRGDKNALVAAIGSDKQKIKKEMEREETPTELIQRIARELDEQHIFKRGILGPPKCTKCGINDAVEEFTIDKELAYCGDCAELLNLGHTKEARKLDYPSLFQKNESKPDSKY